jgi:hypothetical protein
MNDEQNPMPDTPQNSNMLVVFRREFLCGQTRETAREKWGDAFDDKLWDHVEKIGRADPEELAARPHPRDIFKREFDHSHPRNEALEKWGPGIEVMIERDLARGKAPGGKRHKFPPDAFGPDTARRDGPDWER